MYMLSYRHVGKCLRSMDLFFAAADSVFFELAHLSGDQDVVVLYFDAVPIFNFSDLEPKLGLTKWRSKRHLLDLSQCAT